MFEYDIANVFKPYLSTGERILWTGQPKQGIAFSGRDAFLIPFSLLWGGFALFWNYSVWTFPKTDAGDNWFFKLWGMPFLIAGGYFVLGRFIHDAVIRRTLFYAVTNQRVLIFRKSRSSKFTSLGIDRLPMLEFSEFGDGTGTISFDPGALDSWPTRKNSLANWTPSVGSAPQFFRIADGRRIYELIRNQAQT